MPADYLACVKNYVNKGVSTKTAKARCAAWFYKKHGYTVKEAHEKGWGSAPQIEGLDLNDSELDVKLVELIMSELEEIEAQKVEATEEEKDDETTVEPIVKAKIFSFNIDMLDDFNVVEIVATKIGAKAYTDDGRAVVWTESGLKAAEKTWALTHVSINHTDKSFGRVLASFLDGRLLRMVVKVNDQLKGWIKRAKDLIGVSIEATAVKIKNFEIVSAKGSGVTFVFPPHEAACTIDEGCGIIAGDVEAQFEPPEAGNLPKEGKEILRKVYNKCRSTMFKEEIPEHKERCSKIAWSAVKKAGFHKDEDGNWVKSTTDAEFDMDGYIKSMDNFGCNYNTDGSTLSISWDKLDDIKYYTVNSHYPWFDAPTFDWSKMNFDLIIKPEGVPTDNNIEEKDIDMPERSDSMADETKEKTICAEKYESDMKTKDSEIEALKKENETLRGIVAKYEEVKKASVLEDLKTEGVETEGYKNDPIETLEKLLRAVRAFKTKLASEDETNSGAKATATEKKEDPEGDALSKAKERTELEAETKAKEDAKLKEIDEKAKRYGY